MQFGIADLRSLFSKTPLDERGGKFFFREVPVTSEVIDPMDRIKARCKAFSKLYRGLVILISPVISTRKPLIRFLEEAGVVVVNVGSGNYRVASHVINVDMFDYEHVDVVADIHDLPFKDGSVDAVMSLAVLEHVRDPEAVILEMYRILKPGGRVFNLIPFMQPFHASPFDYQRYTLPGIKHLHRDFEEVASGVGAGPVSGFLWVFQEWVATMLSFGCVPLRNYIYLVIMLVTWPIKYLDVLYRNFPTATNLASSFYLHARKPQSNS